MHLASVTLHPAKYPTRDFYPFNLRVLQQTERIPFTSPVTLFVGENGSGKSTLLQAIAHACGIHLWRETERRRLAPNPYEDVLCNYLTVEWTDGKVPGSFFGSDIFHHFRQILDEWAAADPGQLDYFGGRSLMTQSHGESLMSFFRSRYRLKGLYLLDEPETALSPKQSARAFGGDAGGGRGRSCPVRDRHPLADPPGSPSRRDLRFRSDSRSGRSPTGRPNIIGSIGTSCRTQRYNHGNFFLISPEGCVSYSEVGNV